jgi:hypothetical protein
MSGRQVQLEDWMIASFDVDYGPEVGVGGLWAQTRYKFRIEFIFFFSSGKVYRGTWNQTEVAIKVLQNVAGVTPSLVVGCNTFLE